MKLSQENKSDLIFVIFIILIVSIAAVTDCDTDAKNREFLLDCLKNHDAKECQILLDRL